MSRSIERIGLLTGGGDCPGLNAVIRAITKTAIYQYGLRVFGIEDGYLGLIENRISELTSMHVSGILARGGTILGSNNRVSPTHYPAGKDGAGKTLIVDATERCLNNMRNHRLDALIVVGGDGTMSCSVALIERGVNIIGVPKTIDNDIVGTDITFGFLTAAATATDALDRLHSTAMSHHRVMVCEVMGRNAGWIALHAGVASGADVILIPEIPFDMDIICEFVTSRMNRGRGFSIVAVAEGATMKGGSKVVKMHDPTKPDPILLGGVGAQVSEEIGVRTGIETRTTVLGYTQRGGPPVARDRVLATQFGHHAVELLVSGASGRMVGREGGMLTDVDIRTAANKQRTVPIDDPLITAARAVRTCFGDEPVIAGYAEPIKLRKSVSVD